MKHKVIIVDDHGLLSQAIGELVNQFQEFETVARFGNGQEVIQALKTGTETDLILMDVNMPLLNGIETTQQISRDFPDIKVLALSVEEDEKTIIAMLKAGAKGYLSKDIPSDLLEEALKATIKNGYYYTANVNHALMESLNKKDELDELKEREVEFIKLACSDMTYKEIADQMFLSPKTIDNYRDAVFSKLNVKNRIGLVLFAIKNGIYKIEDE